MEIKGSPQELAEFLKKVTSDEAEITVPLALDGKEIVKNIAPFLELPKNV